MDFPKPQGAGKSIPSSSFFWRGDPGLQPWGGSQPPTGPNTIRTISSTGGLVFRPGTRAGSTRISLVTARSAALRWSNSHSCHHAHTSLAPTSRPTSGSTRRGVASLPSCSRRRCNPRRHQPHRDILLQLAQLLLNFEDLSTRPLYHPRVLLHRERLDNIRPRQLPDEQRLYRLIQPVGTPRHMPHRRPLVHAVTPVP